MQEKEEKELNDLAVRLSKIIEGFKDIVVDDEREQFFIDKFKDCKIKVDLKKYSNSIYFFDQKDAYLGDYNLKREIFYVSLNKIWTILELKYNLNYNQIKDLIQSWVEQHFKLGPVTAILPDEYFPLVIEQHFKLRP